MNVYSADMMSSEIANLTILVEVQTVKTFYQNNMQTTELNNSTNIKNTTSNLKSLNMSKIVCYPYRNNFVFLYFEYIKHLSGLSMLGTKF